MDAGNGFPAGSLTLAVGAIAAMLWISAVATRTGDRLASRRSAPAAVVDVR